MPSLALLLLLFLPMPKELRPQDIVKPRDKHREERRLVSLSSHRSGKAAMAARTNRAKYDAQLLKNGG